MKLPGAVPDLSVVSAKNERPRQLAACKDTSIQRNKPDMQLFERRSVRYWSKETNGTRTGGEKGNFLIRGRGRPTVYGSRAGGILSIPAQEVSLGSPRVGTIHVQSPTPHTPPLQAFLVDFSQQTTLV